MIVREGEYFRVRGPITMDNVEGLLEEGRRLFADGEVKVDLAGVTEVDSTSVSLLLQWLRDASARGQRLTFHHIAPNIHSLAALYGVTDLIPSE